MLSKLMRGILIMTKWVFGILACILVTISFLFVRLIVLNSTADENAVTKTPSCHLQIAVQDNKEYFWTKFEEGAQAAGDAFNAYVEFVPISKLNSEELRNMVNKAIFSNVDGIALQAADVDETKSSIINASSSGLEVVTYESGNSLIPEVPTIGSNNYDIGLLAGQMAAEAVGENARAAVVFNKVGGLSDEKQQRLILEGVIAGADSTGFEIVGTYILNTELFEADNKSRQLLNNNPNVIICLDERSTPAIAQMLVSQDRVRNVSLIGYGAMPQTLDYIERGVIFGSVCPDAFKIGFDTVRYLTQLLNKNQVSDLIYPEQQRIDINNVADFRQVDN